MRELYLKCPCVNATISANCGDSMSLTVKDLEKLQQAPDYQIELADGRISRSLSGYDLDEVATGSSGKLFNERSKNRLGQFAGAGADFILPNFDSHSPDVSLVLAQQLRKSPLSLAKIVSDWMIEVKSPSDSLKGLQERMNSFGKNTSWYSNSP